MVLAIIALIAVAHAQIDYDLVTSIGGPEGTPHCFDDLNNDYFVPTDFSEVQVLDSNGEKVKTSYVDVTVIQVNAGYFCYFEVDSNAFIYADIINIPDYAEGDETVTPFAYFFEYEGYGPEVFLYGDEACTFKERTDWGDATANLELWFKPNLFGGACKYMVVLGAKAWPAEHSVHYTIVRSQLSALKYGVSMLSVAALALFSV